MGGGEFAGCHVTIVAYSRGRRACRCGDYGNGYGRGVLSRWQGGLAAAVVTLLTGVLVILDVTDAAMRRWWGGHALTTHTVSGLLLPLITPPVIDQGGRRPQIHARARPGRAASRAGTARGGCGGGAWREARGVGGDAAGWAGRVGGGVGGGGGGGGGACGRAAGAGGRGRRGGGRGRGRRPARPRTPRLS